MWNKERIFSCLELFYPAAGPDIRTLKVTSTAGSITADAVRPLTARAAVAGASLRGDTCIGAYMAVRLSRPPHEAAIWAAAVTSLKMENPGPFNRPLEEVEKLIESKYRQ